MKKDRTQTGIVFHCPHDGSEFPEHLMSSLIIPRGKFLEYHEKMRDKAVNELIPKNMENSITIDFNISRLLCDPERFIGDGEVMEKYGMGFCCEKVYDGTVIKKITPELLNATKLFYDEHHRLLDDIVSKHDEIIMVDLHSYHDEIVPDDFYIEGRDYPDICIGTDWKYTPLELAEQMKKNFSSAGFTVAFNYLYSGTMIPNAVLDERTDCRFSGIMVEVNRKAYLNEDGSISENRSRIIRSVIQRTITEF